MNRELDPQLSRLFADYAPEIDSSSFLAQLRARLDREQRHARWRSAIGWSAGATLLLVVAVFATKPLGLAMTAASQRFASLETSLPVAPTPLNVSLIVVFICLCLHRRIRAMLTL